MRKRPIIIKGSNVIEILHVKINKRKIFYVYPDYNNILSDTFGEQLLESSRYGKIYKNI